MIFHMTAAVREFSWQRILGIIVPYRDRAQHGNVFVPHIAAFFSRCAKEIGGSIIIQIVEQAPGLEFNRGFINNIGYHLVKDSCDYVCFHDIDHLPIWADYSEPDGYAPIVWYGAEKIFDPRGFDIRHSEDSLENFSGGVVLFRKNDFERVNGFANTYWGWGFEDEDLSFRCLTENVPRVRRKGTFQIQPHINAGLDIEESTLGSVAKPLSKPSAVHLKNRRLFRERFPSRVHGTPSKSEIASYCQTSMMAEDGLSTAKFSIVAQKQMPPPNTDERGIKIEMVTVSPLAGGAFALIDPPAE